MLRSTSLGGPENAIGFVIWRMMHRFQRCADQLLRPLDLTYLQFVVLGLSTRLGLEQPQPIQADIARVSGIHPMQVSAVLKVLERKKMVRRQAARGVAKSVRITALGLNALRAAFPPMQHLQRKLFGAEGAPHGKLLRQMQQLDLRQSREQQAAVE